MKKMKEKNKMTKSFSYDKFTEKQIQEIKEMRKKETGINMSTSAIICWGINILWDKLRKNYEETDEKKQ